MRRLERLSLITCSGVCGGVLMYFFDPERGRRRRHMARDRMLGRWRRAWRAGLNAWRGAAADAYGVSHRVVHLVPRETDVADDETLRQRVESMLFRHRDVPK